MAPSSDFQLDIKEMDDIFMGDVDGPVDQVRAAAAFPNSMIYLW